MTTLYGIKACDTMKKARAWLEAAGISYQFRDYKVLGVDPSALARWCAAAGWEMVLNRSGTTFRGLAEDQKRDLDATKAMALMQAQPAMIKRPVLEGPGVFLIGFKPEAYAKAFARA